MRQEEGSDNDEEADMLMALAEQAGPTPKSQSQRSSQQVCTALVPWVSRRPTLTCASCNVLDGLHYRLCGVNRGKCVTMALTFVSAHSEGVYSVRRVYAEKYVESRPVGT